MDRAGTARSGVRVPPTSRRPPAGRNRLPDSGKPGEPSGGRAPVAGQQQPAPVRPLGDGDRLEDAVLAERVREVSEVAQAVAHIVRLRGELIEGEVGDGLAAHQSAPSWSWVPGNPLASLPRSPGRMWGRRTRASAPTAEPGAAAARG